MVDRKVVVAAHGHCFDGLVSAAMFTHLRSALSQSSLRFRYLSCGYGPNMQTIPQKWLSGDENAIVDFRYTPTDKLTWYFDHHITAFASDIERDHALAGSQRFFYDAACTSCTKLIARVGQERFGVRFDRFAELCQWADKIDSAQFASAIEAIDKSSPVMQLSAVIEQHGDADFYQLVAPQLLEVPVEEVALSAKVQALWAPIAAATERTQARIERVLEQRDDVAYVDLHTETMQAGGKFVTYAIAPECVYSVAVIRMRQHFKISVGYNPWCNKPRRHDIAAICQRHGGGGHPVVGAVSLPLDRLPETLKLARDIVEELNG
ncbi:MAG: hypothetical protein EXR75_14525 [Myxococcales bacterium]|nr:hypothetical protein [Myxococcales bacterium]